MNKLFYFLQLCDSQFPSGAFSHSFGIETYIQKGVIHDTKSFEEVLKAYVLTQLCYTDGLAGRIAYEASQQKDENKLLKLDQELYALSLSKESREGVKRIGQQMTKLLVTLYSSERLNWYQQLIRKKEANGHPAIAFALVCHYLEAGLMEALQCYLFSSVTAMVHNGVRGIPIGQTDGQKLLISIQPYLQDTIQKILELKEEDLGAASPALELAQMQHESLSVRMFMS